MGQDTPVNLDSKNSDFYVKSEVNENAISPSANSSGETNATLVSTDDNRRPLHSQCMDIVVISAVVDRKRDFNCQTLQRQ